MRQNNRFAFLPKQRELQRTPILPSKPSNRETYADDIRKAYDLPPRKAKQINEERLQLMKMQEVKMIAKEHGHKYEIGMSKQDLINLIVGRAVEPVQDDQTPETERIVVE